MREVIRDPDVLTEYRSKRKDSRYTSSGVSSSCRCFSKNGFTLRHINRYALLTFTMVIFFPVVSFLFQLSGMFSFRAAMYANRIWAMFSLLVMLPLFFNLLHGIRLTYLATLSVILLLTVQGLFMGNDVIAVAADMALFILPTMFYLLSRVIIRTVQEIYSFIKTYLKLNAVFLLFVSLPLYFAGFTMLPDYTFLIAAVLVALLGKGFRYRVFSLVKAPVLFLLVGNKTVLVQAAAGAVLLALRNGVHSFAKGLGFFLLLLLLLFSQFSSFGGSTLKSKLMSALSAVQNVLSTRTSLSDVYYEPFEYLDLSTAHRVYEFKKVMQEIIQSPLTIFLGRGMGAAIDLSETLDHSVVAAHGGRDHLVKVRVVHLGIAYMLLKGGVVLLVLYLFVLATVFRLSFFLTGAKCSWESQVVGVALLLYALGSLFTFSQYAKLPSFWIFFGIGIALAHSKRCIERVLSNA